MPKISVIICIYNGEKFIKDAIESVLAQTFRDFELIIVDDGSNDQSKNLVGPYVHRFPDKVRYIYKDHSGLSSTRNRGINEAAGEYISFLDHDDTFHPQKLQKQLDVILNSSIGLVHCARYTKDIHSDEEPIIRPQMPARNRIEFLEGKGHISMTILTKKSTLVNSGMFDENLLTSNDTDMWLRIAKNHEIAFIEEPLMTFLIHGSNMSLIRKEQKYKDRITVAWKVIRDKDIRVSKIHWRMRVLNESQELWKIKLKKNKFIQVLVNLKRKIQGIPVQ